MNWSSVLPALFGTLVGGLITISGQYWADKRKEVATQAQHDRQVRRGDRQQARLDAIALLDRVASDISDFRLRVAPMLANMGNLELAESMEPVRVEFSAVRDRSLSLIAKVADGSVRQAARDVYESWGTYMSAVEDDAVNGTDRANRLARLALASPARFYARMTQYLESIDKRDEAKP